MNKIENRDERREDRDQGKKSRSVLVVGSWSLVINNSLPTMNSELSSLFTNDWINYKL